jgi:hypothetical protein
MRSEARTWDVSRRVSVMTQWDRKEDYQNEAWSRPGFLARAAELKLLHIPHRDDGSVPWPEVSVRGAMCTFHGRTYRHLWMSHEMPGLWGPRWLTACVWQRRYWLQGPMWAETCCVWSQSWGQRQIQRKVRWVALRSSYLTQSKCHRIVDRLCGLVFRVPGYTMEMYCVSCEVRTEFIYVM